VRERLDDPQATSRVEKCQNRPKQRNNKAMETTFLIIPISILRLSTKLIRMFWFKNMCCCQ